MRKVVLIVVFSFFICSFIALLSGTNQTTPARPNTNQSPTPEVTTRAQEVGKALATYLYENFGGAGNPEYATSWYPSIKTLSVRFTSSDEAEVIVGTPYVAGKKDRLAEHYADTIATVIANSGQVSAKTIHVTVYGQNGLVGAWSFYKK